MDDQVAPLPTADINDAAAAPPSPPLPMLRQDLELLPASRQPGGSPAWSIYDPLNHQFFRIGWLEFEILSHWQLGNAEEVAKQVRQTTTLAATPAQVLGVQQFLTANRLLAQMVNKPGTKSPAAGGGMSQLVSKWLYNRFPLLEPDEFLTATTSWTRPFYSKWFWRWTLLAGCLGIYLITRQWENFITTFIYLFTPIGLFSVSATMFTVKFGHELAHAYTAKRYGAKVPVIGVALLVIWPLFYTDTTDAWRLTKRRQRMTIGAAGILFELAIAVHATLLWSFVAPGPLKSILFILATSTWLTSLLVNLNPCMRYDGYYLLSDLWDIPNLQTRAFTLARWFLRRNLLGSPEPCPERLKPRMLKMMGAYAVIVWIYRLFVFTAIALMVYHFAFKALGIILFIVEISVFLVNPITNELRIWWEVRKGIGMNQRQINTIMAISVGLGALIYPWPTWIYVPAVHKAELATAVHVPHSGQLKQIHVQRGDSVTKGDLLFVVASPQFDYQVDQALRRVNQLKLELTRIAFEKNYADRLRIVEQQLITAKAELAGFHEQQARQQVLAPISGRIMEMDEALTPEHWVNPELELCLLVNDQKTTVEGYAPEADLPHITPAMTGRFYPENSELPTIQVKLKHLDRTNHPILEDPYMASIFGGPIAVRRDDKDRLITEQAVYLLQFDTESTRDPVNQIWRGTVRLKGQPQNMFSRAWRAVMMVLIQESEF